jgi:hypothetical protein
MSQNPYDYSTRKGICPISWEDFHGLCKALAAAASRFELELLIPAGEFKLAKDINQDAEKP